MTDIVFITEAHTSHRKNVRSTWWSI